MILTLLACTATFGSTPMPNQSNPASSAAFLKEVATVSNNYAHTVRLLAEKQNPATAIPQKKIPGKVLKSTLRWVGKTLREPYAGALAKSPWTGYPNSRHFEEVIAAAATVGDATVKWSDTGPLITLLVRVREKTVPADAEGREQWLLDGVERYLKVRKCPPDQVRYTALRKPSETSGLWGGDISRALTKKPNGDYVRPLGWDCHLKVITDGKWLLIQMNARDDKVVVVGGMGKAYMVGEKRPIPKKSRFDK